jgi:hypothetical protein
VQVPGAEGPAEQSSPPDLPEGRVTSRRRRRRRRRTWTRPRTARAAGSCCVTVGSSLAGSAGRLWLALQKFEHPAQQIDFQDHIDAMRDVVIAAIAREMVAFIWAIGREVELHPPP